MSVTSMSLNSTARRRDARDQHPQPAVEIVLDRYGDSHLGQSGDVRVLGSGGRPDPGCGLGGVAGKGPGQLRLCRAGDQSQHRMKR